MFVVLRGVLRGLKRKLENSKNSFGKRPHHRVLATGISHRQGRKEPLVASRRISRSAKFPVAEGAWDSGRDLRGGLMWGWTRFFFGAFEVRRRFQIPAKIFYIQILLSLLSSRINFFSSFHYLCVSGSNPGRGFMVLGKWGSFVRASS
jgi:hypothetical protein